MILVESFKIKRIRGKINETYVGKEIAPPGWRGAISTMTNNFTM